MRNEFASPDQPEEARRTAPGAGVAESSRRGAESGSDPVLEEHIVLGED
ncbi:hypothetical protein [Streptomyces bambusae]|uniref:Uncharacterized protein n=1 Tax=Streptomyces bambusae TaxID=1550616 RepID=A0ABS6Z322_9ACTN|nr:hypothetical protein [Streptomyces bambusae]MBW5482155.1 hypothetical protein [Streptomyces bambusae]